MFESCSALRYPTSSKHSSSVQETSGVLKASKRCELVHQVVEKTKILPKSDILVREDQVNTSASKRQKQECGIVTELNLGIICVLFEGLPMWLFGLTNLKCKHIYLPAIHSFTHLLESLETLQVDLQLFNNLIQHIGRRKFKFCAPEDKHTLHLVSGSLKFLNDQYGTLQNKIYIMILGEHKTYRKIPSLNLDLRRITHQACGGETSFSTLYATSEVGRSFKTTVLR